MTLSIGFSPCPNDTFIFDALVNQKIDTGDLRFNVMLEDIETLNRWALKGMLDISKLSFPAFFQALDEYLLISSGAALGNGVGPILISQKQVPVSKVAESTIAIPGLHTTANLLLTFAFPAVGKKIYMIFHEIEDALLTEKTDLGVIIHENRFTYEQKGLIKILDLGDYWQQKMNLPIPLGGVAMKRSIDKKLIEKVNQLINKSIVFAFNNYPMLPDYVKQHSQEMSEEVMRKHIELYVTNYSLELGNEGKKAIEVLFNTYLQMNGNKKTFLSSSNLFLS